MKESQETEEIEERIIYLENFELFFGRENEVDVKLSCCSLEYIEREPLTL